MNTKDLKFQGVTKNLKYIFTNKGIIPTSDYFNNGGNMISYNVNNLPLAIDILKEHKELYYKKNLISLTEYANSARGFLNEVLDIIEPKYQITIIKEWDYYFGNNLLLINESTDKLLIESRINDSWESIKHIIMEAWYNPLSWDWKGAAKNAYDWTKKQVKGAVDWTIDQGRQIKEKGVLGWAKDKVVNIFKAVRDAVVAAWNCLANNFIECLMEGIRSAAFSAIGMGVTTALMFVPPIGEIIDYAIFGSLLIWDIYKMLSGKYESGEYKWSWTDIIVDAVCLLLPAIGGALKVIFRGVKSAFGIGVKAATTGGIAAKAVKAVIGGLSKITGYMGKAAVWFGEKLGIKWLSKFGARAEAQMVKSTAEIEKGFIKGETENLVKQGTKDAAELGAKETAELGTKETAELGAKEAEKRYAFVFNKPLPYVLKKSGKTVLITAELCAALGLDGWTCHEKAENGELDEEQILAALESNDAKLKMNQISAEDGQKMGLW